VPTTRRRRSRAAVPTPEETQTADVAEAEVPSEDADTDETDEAAERKRRRRGRRGRGKGRAGENGDGAESGDDTADGESADATDATDDAAPSTGPAEIGEADGDEDSTSRRRRRRRRRGAADADDTGPQDPPQTVVHVREPRATRRDRAEDEVQGVRGSTRLEAKRQRRRDGRDQGRRRPPILSEAEFLARREAVDRVMVVRQRGDRTQIAVLEDGVLVEHYVTKASSTSYAGNVYLGRVQNVLPSMEAAFIDIGKGRNAVLYAGEVDWDVAGLEGKARSIEHALRSGDTVIVQVTKDPIGHKGARLTSQVSLPGRYLVYVPNGSMTGISRKLPDTERSRLKEILRRIVPEDAGVIIRTAAEGASEDELTRDVTRLQAQWEVIQQKASSAPKSAPSLLYGEPDLAIRVVRDVFNEDFTQLVVSGEEAWETIEQYVSHVAPDLAPRLSRHAGETDAFAELRIDEQLMKALDRKVWLPSGGSLVIDRTEAMTVIDVNTGKFTGQGGTLEQTVTRNNLEAAEEVVRQLRLRDIGGIIVIDFIDMVLESNRELVLRRLTECLGRDRTKHQVAEVTSLGLVQMTRKRVGQGLLEAFSEPCPTCGGRGLLVHADPVDDSKKRNGQGTPGPAAVVARSGRRGRRGDAEPEALPAIAAESTIGEDAAAAWDDVDIESIGLPAGGDAEADTARPGRQSGRIRSRRPAGGDADEPVEPTDADADAGRGPSGRIPTGLPSAGDPVADASSTGGRTDELPEAATGGHLQTASTEVGAGAVPRRRRRAVSRPAGPPAHVPAIG
jgi:ribonuclease E